MVQNGIRWIGSYFFNRLLAGIWVPMLAGIAFAVLLAVGLGMVDRAGWTDWVRHVPGPFDFGQAAADELIDTILAVQVAVLTLYFSITLIVLTLAAQSLGARLIERWIARVEIRASLAQWASLVAFSLVAQLFVAPEGPDAQAPRMLVLVDLAMTLMALGWLGYGYHRLVRTMHVDTSVAEIGRSFAADRQDWALTEGPDPEAAPDGVLRAWASGYLGGFDRDRLIDMAHRVGGRIAIALPDGEFVVEGDPLARLWGDDGRMADALRESCEIASYRADRPTGPFSLALLVEIGARALSPSVNDPQTAGTCADWIGHGLVKRLGHEAGPEGWFADEDGEARLFVPEAGVVAQAMPYLAMLHRSARDHPFVVERLVRAYRVALARAVHAPDRKRLSALIDDIVEQDEGRTPFEAGRIAGEVARARRAPAATGALAAE